MNPYVRTKPRLIWRGGALLGSAVVVAMVTGPTAYAASDPSGGDVKVVNTETVQVYMDANAKPTSQRVYEQLGLTGDGKVDLRNPIATKGLRNLDGFSGVDVKRGEQVVDTTVHGEKNYRSVSDYTGKLPLDVDVDYTLDGKKVQPGDVVGKSGTLKVTYTVTNRTAEEQQVTWKDGDGKTQTTTEDVVIPMVGTLTTTAPNSFRDVSSKEANMAGDGKGGTKLSYTMTLFPPIGAPSATFGYTAKITDGVVPKAEINALPVNPLESPTFSKAAESYQGGADTGRELTDGATKIDTNLLKLRDGSQELLAGLIQLSDGSDELAEGLSGKAVPGAKKLDAGANALTVGLNKLLAGTGDLKDGTGKLSAGTKKALGGGKKLSAGLQQISGGLDLLQSQLTSKKSSDGIEQIRTGISALIAGVGTEADAKDPTKKTLLGGLTQLKGGIDGQLTPGAANLRAGLVALKGDGTVGTAAGGLSGIQKGLAGGVTKLDEETLNPGGKADQLIGSLGILKGSVAGTCTVPNLGAIPCAALASRLQDGAVTSKQDLTTLRNQLNAAAGGLGTAVGKIGDPTAAPTTDTLIGGTLLLSGGLNQLSTGAGDLVTGANAIRSGLLMLQDGYGQLIGKLGEATTGITQLDDGAATASTGSDALALGLGDLNTGAGKLDAGAGKLRAGTGQAASGSKQISTGTGTLATGLIAAGAGSEKLSAGLRKAAKAAPALPEGAQKLSTQGTQKLIQAGRDTTKTYAENVAVLTASAERADTKSMAYGAPADASSLTAYSYQIAGDDGESSRNLVRTLGGVGVLAASGGVLLLRRRFLA